MTNGEAFFLVKAALEKLEWLRGNTKLPIYKEVELAEATKSIRDVFLELGKKMQNETGKTEFSNRPVLSGATNNQQPPERDSGTQNQKV